jgi:hypothetical protein
MIHHASVRTLPRRAEAAGGTDLSSAVVTQLVTPDIAGPHGPALPDARRYMLSH